MKFSKVLPLLSDEFSKAGIDFSLIGGVALYFSGSPRTTFDVDFLTVLAQSDRVDEVMRRLGYSAVQRSEEAANYVSSNPDLGQVDFLFAHRKYTLEMLRRADKKDVLGHSVKVLKPEDLIGLKVQSSSNDPARAAKDHADIEDLMRRNADSLDWNLVQEYFKLFGREAELQELRKKLQ